MAEPSPQEKIARMVTASWVAQAIYVAAKLGIADMLEDGPRTAEELAEASETHARSLYRLLRALASLGIFSEGEGRQFSLTPMAECLRTVGPGSQRALALMAGEEQYHAWGDLLWSVKTGQTAFDKVYGRPIFDYLAERPEQARIFDAAMTSIHGRETAAFLDAYDLAGVEVVADIGGGNGSTLAGILTRHPALKGILYDLPGVADHASKELDAAGLSGRCEAVGGSFFESVPGGADVYLLRHIIHDWDDEKAKTILKHVHDAMDTGARLLVVETVIPPGNEPSFAKVLDLTMLLIPGGQERTEEEYRALFAAAGFRLTKIVPTAADVSVIEGMKA